MTKDEAQRSIRTFYEAVNVVPPHITEGAVLERGLYSIRSPSLAMAPAPETDVRYGRINVRQWRSRAVRRRLNYPWSFGRRSDKRTRKIGVLEIVPAV